MFVLVYCVVGFRSMFAGQDEQARENMRREKRRIQDRLRRLKKEKVTKKPKKEKPKSAAAIKVMQS